MTALRRIRHFLANSANRTTLRRLAALPAVQIAGATIVVTLFLASTQFLLYSAKDAGNSMSPWSIALAAIACVACAAIAPLVRANRRLRNRISQQETRLEALADRLWELREAEERIKDLLESRGDIIVRRKADGEITYVNDAFCAIAGQPRDALVGHKFTLPVIDEGPVSLTEDGTRVYDQKISTKGDARWISWHEASIRTDVAGERQIQCVGRDITARVLSEHVLAVARDQADAANRAKNRFLAMVSHEIRTPLNGILGLADLLGDTTLTPEQKSYVKAVRASGDALLSLIEEILDFSKIEAGKLELDAQPFALEPLVESAVELLAPRAQAKSIDIASYVDEQLPRVVLGDPTRLRQVLLNLAGNAVKFTEHGGVTVTVSPGASAGDVVITVRDTGIGIGPEAQQRIFEEFEQGDDGAARKYAGTGLGLAISKRIVEKMGGKLALESTPGIGSAFTLHVSLPAAEAAQTGYHVPRHDHARALIVAAGDIEAPLIARRLNNWGMETQIRSDAAEAAADIGKECWDTVMVDLNVGIKNAIAIARQSQPAIARRIVLLTPQERRDLPALTAEGFSDYLIKPVRAESLAARFGAPSADVGEAEPPRNKTISRAVKPLTILVAEDNEINALLARALLARLGHVPIVVGGGEEAVETFRAAVARQHPFDLVLMDVQMPGVDGLAATRRIRAFEAELGRAETPIVALTANVSAEDRDTCLKAGMSSFLTKPLDRERLAEALEVAPKRGLAA